MEINLIHHYTNIDTLALILKNKTIRFNRLDRLDDISEGESFNILKLSTFLFVSCWTYDQEENIPQWNMYTERMTGVRISLPKNFFNYQPLKKPEDYPYRIDIEEGITSPIPFEKMFGESYMIAPNFINNIDKFGKEVEYCKDYKERKNSLINVMYGTDNKSISQIKLGPSTEIACFKDTMWSFQKEFRFVLVIFPILKDKPITEETLEFQKRRLSEGKGPDLTYFDVDINPKIFNKIQITIGPLCTESEIILVESLLEKYAPSGTISKSKFTGTIRKSH